MFQVKVIQGTKQTTIDGCISIDEYFGDVSPIMDFCGGLSGVCPGCKQLKKGRCGNPFFTGFYRRLNPKELLIETPEKDYIFTGDDYEYEVLNGQAQ